MFGMEATSTVGAAVGTLKVNSADSTTGLTAGVVALFGVSASEGVGVATT